MGKFSTKLPSATPLSKPIVESLLEGYDAEAEYSWSKVEEYREKCLVDQGLNNMNIESGHPQLVQPLGQHKTHSMTTSSKIITE
ncbi:hypothetical protein U1Q18_042755 [Sarracenia purpurea var. burkii]